MKNWKIMAGIAVLALGLAGCATYPAGPGGTYYHQPTYPAYAPASSVGIHYYSGDRRYYRQRDYRRDRIYRRGHYQGRYYGRHGGKRW